jgi:hypothetical protein
MPELHETLMGRKLIEGTLPEIARQLERIADCLEKKKEEDQIGNASSAFKNYINNYPDDKELGQKIREIWEK